MAITNFIPTIWSEMLYENLKNHYVAANNCNRDFEGDIREKGDTVKICGLQNVLIRDYERNKNMSSADTLTDFSRQLKIDHAKYFNFQIDDIDRAQSSPKLMKLALNNAAAALASEADTSIFQLQHSASKRISVPNTTPSSVFDAFLEARRRLYEENVVNSDDIIIEVTPAIAEMILKAKIDLGTDNFEALENGCIGKIAGCKVFVSRNIMTEQIESDLTSFCIMRTKRSVAFAEQLSEIQAYRPELRFADAVKGLHLYGTGIIYPNEYIAVDFVTVFTEW